MRGMAKIYRAHFERLDEEGRIRREGGLRIFSEVYPHKDAHHHVKLWRGKQSKPFYDFLVGSNRVEEVIAEYVDVEVRSAEYAAERKAEAKQKAEKNYEGYTVGTLIHGSWGYDQTNCEFYEIVERPTGSYAVIREIASKVVAGSEGFMSCELRPIAGEYIGEPVRKKITSYGIGEPRYGHCKLTPTEPDTSHYSSWYA